jgi:hypothetical protein
MAYKTSARVHVAVHTMSDPGVVEWGDYLADIGASLDRIDGVYSLTVGGGPTASQRAQAVEFWKKQPKTPRIAVVTPSMLVVRMVGALRWFMPSQIKAFGSRDTDSAYAYLGLTKAQIDAVEAAVLALRRRLSIDAA